MVQEQLAAPGRDIRDPRVLQAMGAVPRQLFVPEKARPYSYDDYPLPIGHGQTISQPFIVAYMIEQLPLDRGGRVLEIGSGSGYAVAVLSHLFDEVFGIEIVEPLASASVAALMEAGCTNVHVRSGDGYQGWPEHAPFDAIIVSCAPTHVPAPLVEQLAEGGRLVIPVGDGPDQQQLHVLEKSAGQLTEASLLRVRFVPMTGQAEDRAPWPGGEASW